MSYKWKPNASQRKAFAEKMQNSYERKAYEERKYAKSHYEGFKNKSFIPTEFQYQFAMKLLGMQCSQIVTDAANQITMAYVCQDKCHHQYIHIINSIQRNDNTELDTIFKI